LGDTAPARPVVYHRNVALGEWGTGSEMIGWPVGSYVAEELARAIRERKALAR
jgi:hypothetical protein